MTPSATLSGPVLTRTIAKSKQELGEKMATTDKSKSAASVVELHPSKKTKAAESASHKKWGSEVMKVGFCMVPSLLLRAQQRLGLNPTQLAVLLQLCDFWWESARKPRPSKKVLSERLGISERQIQRYMKELETAGLISRIERRAQHKGKLPNEYDLSGLVARLKQLEPEFRDANEKAKKMKKMVTQRGGIPSALKQEGP